MSLSLQPENSDMMKLSAVIITFNEEKNIGRCLDSLEGIADEIVVVDSNSSDKTVAICKEYYGVKVYEQEFLGYSGQKNYANALATNDYIFSIDADEALSLELKNELLELKKKGFPAKAYEVNRFTNYCGKWLNFGGWYPDKKLRLWNRHQAEWTGHIHEVIELPEDVFPFELKGKLLHYTFHTKDQHLKQADKFTSMTAQEAFQKGKKSSQVKIVASSSFKFIKDYFFKLGFLDGIAGFNVAFISAKATAMKYRKLLKLRKGA